MSMHLTTAPGHGIKVGDRLEFDGGPTLRELIRRPRITVVTAVTHTTISCEERRMTWAEWRSALWQRAIRWLLVGL